MSTTETTDAALLSAEYPVFFGTYQLGWGEEVWKPIPMGTDEFLIDHKAKLAGWVRDTRALSPDERSLYLKMFRGGDKRLSDEERRLFASFCERSPYTHHRVPFLDLDVATKHPDFTPERAINLSLKLARALTKTCQEVGLGTPQWSVSNEYGGMHGRLAIPPVPPSGVLPYALWKLVRDAADKAGVTCLSRKRKEADRESRPIVGLDDNLFNRKGSSRGDVWRLRGLKKPKAGSLSVPVEIGEEGDEPKRLATWPEPGLASAEAVMASVREQEGLAAAKRAVEEERRKAAAEARAERELRRAEARSRGEPEDVGTDWPARYVEIIVERNLQKMASASEGQRNKTLHDVAHYFAGLEAGGAFIDNDFTTDYLKRSLADAAEEAEGHTRGHIESVIEIAWRTGLARPVTPPPVRETKTTDGRTKVAIEGGKTIVFGKKTQERKVEKQGHKDSKKETKKKRLTRSEQKAFLRAAEGINPPWAISKAIKRARLCGDFRSLLKCSSKTCGKTLETKRIVCENAYCPDCSGAYLTAMETALAASKKHLPDVVAAGSIKFPDADPKKVRSNQREIKDCLRKAQKGLESRVRWVRAPGEVFFYAAAEDAPLIELAIGKDNTRLLTRVEAARVIRLVVQKRHARILGYFDRNDPEGFVGDAWTKSFVATSAGKAARKTLPWPNLKEIRQVCKEIRDLERGKPPEEEEHDRSTCKHCGAVGIYVLERGGRKVSGRSDHHYGIADIEKLQEHEGAT